MIIFFFLQKANSYIAYQFESYKQCSSQNFKSSSSSSVFVAISILPMTWIPKKIIFIVSHNGPCYLSFSLNSRWLRRLIRAITLLNGVFQGWSFVVKSACLWRFPEIKCKILAINSMKDIVVYLVGQLATEQNDILPTKPETITAYFWLPRCGGRSVSGLGPF